MPPAGRRPAGLHPFAPWLAPPEQLAQTLVGRDELLHDLLSCVVQAAQGATANHTVLVGPRGVGKTHMLCLVDHHVSGLLDPPEALAGQLSGWVPVLFAEEECAAQNSLANFLLNLIQKLHEGSPLEQLWQLPPDLLEREDAAVCECCLERLHRFHRDRQQRILILIDNLQRVLAQWVDDDHGRLRGFLSGQSFVLVIGTAQTVFDEIMSQRAAFHQFFELRHMGELTEDQVLELMSRRFQVDGREREFEARRAELARKIPAIQKLAGGNPRLVVFLYHIATRTTFIEIEGALHDLIEEVREYFMRRFEALKAQPRKILDTLAQMAGPATPTEIARAAREPVGSVNTQLRRLAKKHYVQRVKLKRQRATRYDITERLFRIWRQTATVAGRRRFRFLVEFLKLYFSPDEIRSLYAQHARVLRSDVGAERQEVIRHVDDMYYFQAATDGELRYDILSTRVETLKRIGETGWAEEEARHLAGEVAENGDTRGTTAAHRFLSTLHAEAGRHDDALKDVEALLQARAYADVVAQAETLAGQMPDSAKAWALLGWGAFCLLEDERALGAFRKATELGGDDPWLWTWQAMASNALGNYDEAERCADEALALDPENAWAWQELGVSVGNTGDPERALTAFRKAAELGEPTARLWTCQAIALRNLKRYDEAASCADRAVAMHPDDARAWEELGLAVGGMGNYERALRAFRTAAEKAKPTAWLWRCQAVTLNYLKRYDEASKCAEAAVALDPADVRAWKELGFAARDRGDHQRALRAFQTAAEKSGPTADLWRLQAQTLGNLARQEEALACADQAIALERDNVFAIDLRAHALHSLGRTQEAVDALDRALGLEPNVHELLARRAWMLGELGRVDDALASVASAEEHGASARDVHHARGEILLLTGSYQVALDSLEAGLTVEPDDWDLTVSREIALACLGQHGVGMQALPAALRRAEIPEASNASACEFVFAVARRAQERGEDRVCLGLFRAALAMEPWQPQEWFGQQVGAFLRQVLDIQACLVPEMVRMLRESVSEGNVLRLLDPFLQAEEFIRTRDLVILERLFPEVRELVLDIVHRAAPKLDELTRPAR